MPAASSDLYQLLVSFKYMGMCLNLDFSLLQRSIDTLWHYLLATIPILHLARPQWRRLRIWTSSGDPSANQTRLEPRCKTTRPNRRRSCLMKSKATFLHSQRSIHGIQVSFQTAGRKHGWQSWGLSAPCFAVSGGSTVRPSKEPLSDH